MSKHSQQFYRTSSPTASLFDIWAERSLHNSIKPAWEYLCKLLKSKYSSEISSARLTNILKYSDEIFYFLLLLVEEYNLRNKSASITESFYELTRQCHSAEDSFLFRHAKLISLVSVVILPYLSEKVEAQYKKVKEEMSINPQSISPMQKRFFIIYPKLVAIAKWVRIINYILYIFNYTAYGNPILYLSKMQLKYGSKIVDHNTSPQKEEEMSHKIIRRISNLFLSLFSKLVPLMLHGLQFVDMFYEHDVISMATALLPATVPPGMPGKISTHVKLPHSKKQCPLCCQMHRNPTTISICGFVFCYSCIYRYIETYKCCPITYRPCDIKDLITLHQ